MLDYNIIFNIIEISFVLILSFFFIMFLLGGIKIIFSNKNEYNKNYQILQKSKNGFIKDENLSLSLAYSIKEKRLETKQILSYKVIDNILL